MSSAMNSFFKDGAGIRVVRLSQWLNWAGGYDSSVFIALPMIQRGSVWKPAQIINLWDSVLRGMPLGSLMVSRMPAGQKVRPIGSKELREIPENGGLGLIDGQQRTLSMLITWPTIGQKMDRRLWVDFTARPGDEHLFRLHVTTKNHPFGFQKASPSAKLSLDDRRKARISHITENNIKEDVSKTPDYFIDSKPWESDLPIDLSELIELWQKDKDWWETRIMEKLKGMNRLKVHRYDDNGNPQFRSVSWTTLTPEVQEKTEKRVSEFKKSLTYLFNLEIPLIEVRSDIFDEYETEEQENIDPALAVLFKRIGTGGTPLTDADYVYSVIKHRLPEAYTLVENLHSKDNIASLLSATDLVMTAVRLAAAEMKTDKPLADFESPSKQDFHRMLKHTNFLPDGFLPLLRPGALDETFDVLTKLLRYREEDDDIGLPYHAFPILERPLVQVLLRWVRQIQVQGIDDVTHAIEGSRSEVLRFVMFWQLCVFDPKKASKVAFEELVKPRDITFPGKAIYQKLTTDNIAIPLIEPKTLKNTGNIVFSDPESKLRGWKRFEIKSDASDDVKKAVSLYSRWWNKRGGHHVHPILLWLQREMVVSFKGDPVAGRDEETPYDYDHICPSSHWYDWTGSGGENRIIDFFDEKTDRQGHWRVGNSIGNLRVWDSTDNRTLSDASPRKKLKLEDGEERSKLLRQSAIDESQIEHWLNCSCENQEKRIWNEMRAKEFQRAVEMRTFSLYESYFNDLKFVDWQLESS